MRVLRSTFVLALLLSPLYADYVVLVNWDDRISMVYSQGKPTIFDVTGDSVPDIFTADSTTVEIFNAVTGLVWEFPFVKVGETPVVTNTDNDPAEELVVSTAIAHDNVEPRPCHFGIYDCGSHALEFASPEGYAVVAVADVNDDARAEVFTLDSSGVFSVWGWTSGVDESPASTSHVGSMKASPVPARRSVNFTLPASAGPGSILITDAAGRIVRTLPAPDLSGCREARWDCLDNRGCPVPAGTYLYRLGETGGKLEVVR